MDEGTARREVISNNVLLKQTFSNLRLADLNRCKRVCKDWARLAAIVELKRTTIEQWFYAFATKAPSAHFGSGRRKQFQHEPNDQYIAKNFTDFREFLQRKAKEVGYWSRPSYGFLFHGGFCPSSRKVESLFEYELFVKYIPRDCRLFVVNANAGIVGSSNDLNAPFEVQAGFASLAAISYLFTPKYASESDCGITVFDENDNLEQFLPSKSGQYIQLKALVVFTVSSENLTILKYVDNVIKRYGEKLAVGGAVVDKVGLFEAIKPKMRLRTKQMLGIAFHGEKIRSASIVLRTTNEEATKNQLIEFRSTLDFNPDLSNGLTETIGFIFICNGRGVSTYDKENVDSSVFKQVFPNVRLTGVFGYGEYGIDFLPNRNASFQKFVNSYLDWHMYWHSFTTVIVLIQLNRN